MSHDSDSQPVLNHDDVQRELCQRLAVAMRTGIFGFQIRCIKQGESGPEAWIYVHQDHQWEKRDDLALPSSLTSDLLEQMELISTREYSDAWTCRRISHSDRTDFELKFRREHVESHLDNNLESYLYGALFLAQHDSGKDARRRIRGPDQK